MYLSTIATYELEATKTTINNTNHFLNYLTTHTEAKMRFYKSDTILNIHSDASYLSAKNERRRGGGIFFLGSLPQKDKPILLNGAFYTLWTMLLFVSASSAEAELGALFSNIKEGIIFRLTLQELGHPQPPTPIHCDNKTTAGIVNGTVKQHQDR